MATFSVDITSVIFAGARTGYKDITITGMPEGGVTTSITPGSYFTYINNPESKGTNVYRVSTKSTNKSSTASERKGTFKITNKSDSTDYVTISLTQCCTYGENGFVQYILSNYSDIYGTTKLGVGFGSAYFPYSLSDSTSKVEVYVDGTLGTVTTSDSWISYVRETTYSDTGFTRLLVSCINNYDGPRQGSISLDGTKRCDIYQNGYPSSTSGCTQSLSFLKSGGTESITLSIPSEDTVSNVRGRAVKLIDFTSPKLTRTSDSTTRPLKWNLTIGTNNTGNDLENVVWFDRNDDNKYYGHTIITQSSEDIPSSILEVDPTVLTYPASGGAGVLDVTYSGTLTTSEFPSWLTYETVNVDTTHRSYTITASKNSSTSSRSFNLEISNGTDTITVPVTQAGAEAASLTISPTGASVGSAAGTTTVTVTSTGVDTVECSIAEGWVSLKTQSGNVYTFSYTANTNSYSRTAIVTFSASGVEPVTYTLVQSAVVLPDVPGSFKVYPKKLRYYGEGGGRMVSFTNRPEGGIDYEITYIDGSDWLSVTDSGPDKYVSATENSGIRRRASIRFYDANDTTNYVVVQVIQGNIDGYNSIWMDDLYYPESRDDNGNYYYRLVNQKNNAEYFEGVSTKPANFAGEIGGIDIPRLIDGHLHSLLLSGSSSDWSDMLESYLTVDIYNMTENGYPGVVDATFKYCNDWSRFEKRYDYTRSLNDPINGKGCDNMIIPFCVYYDDEATFSIVDTEKNGNVNTYTLSKPSTPFAMRTNNFYDTKKLEYKQDDEVIFSYDMDHCGLGAFIYRNRFGGWDSFLIEGNIIKTDNYTKLNWRRKGEYNQGYHINTLKYINEKVTDSVNIDTTYQAYTGWLSDEEAERLVFHLLSSPIVYFQNLHKENQVFDTDPLFNLMPIRITTSSAEYKKFRNGKKLVNYLITFEKSNTEKVRD